VAVAATVAVGAATLGYVTLDPRAGGGARRRHHLTPRSRIECHVAQGRCSDGSGSAHAGFGIYQAFSLASGDGCVTGPTVAASSPTPTALAAQLAGLPRSTVLSPPRPAQVLGRGAVHLRLRIRVACPSYYRVANTAGGNRGITYAPNGLPDDVVIDFWVLRAGGVVLVVDEWHDVDAPADLRERAQEARESIRFVADG